MSVRLAIVFGLLALAALRAGPAPSGWSVDLNGVDVTAAASPRVQGDKVLVNLSALAPLLRLRVQALGREAAIRDASGTEWRGRDGGTELLAGPRRLQLPLPILMEGASLFVPVEAVSLLSGLSCTVDDGGKRVRLGDSAPQVQVAPEGWEPLTVQRTPQEKEEFERARLGAAGRAAAQRQTGQFPSQLPPDREAFRFQIGQGYVQGADGGTELMGSGKIGGFETSLSTFFTTGRKGVKVLNGRASVRDPDSGRELQGGDVFSELWGMARGLRYSQPLAGGHQASLGLYLQTRPNGPIRPVFSLADRWQIGKYVAIGGEIGSDRSHMARAELGTSRFNASGYYRHAREAQGKSFGVSGGYNIFRRVSIQGRFSQQGQGAERLDWRSVSVRFPLAARVDLTLEHILLRSPLKNERLEVAYVSFPVGRLRVFLRYQNRASSLLRTSLQYTDILTGGHELISQVSFSTRRFSVDFQGSTQWRREGGQEQREQLVSRFQISRKTEFQLISTLPDVTAPQNLQAGIKHQLRKTVSVTVEYGNFSGYQNYSYHLPERVFRVMLRKDFDIKTPAGGGEARGRVADTQGRPVASAVVRLGKYSTATDENGEYRIDNVPKGEYKVSLEEEALSADYVADGAVYSFQSKRGVEGEFNFAVSSLDTIRGAVYIDENGDGKRGEGEGLARAAVQLEDKVTATIENGVFGFYNVTPGIHTVRLNTDLLPKDLTLVSPASVEVTLEPGKPVTGIEFRLKRKVREIQFQQLEENPK